MDTTTITVTGPGGTNNYPAELIKRALEAAGIPVIYKNPHPPTASTDEFLYKIRERCAALDLTHKPIELIVNHMPWSG